MSSFVMRPLRSDGCNGYMRSYRMFAFGRNGISRKLLFLSNKRRSSSLAKPLAFTRWSEGKQLLCLDGNGAAPLSNLRAGEPAHGKGET